MESEKSKQGEEHIGHFEPSDIMAEEDLTWVVSRMWGRYSSSSSMTLHNLTDLFNAFTHENIPPNECIDFLDSMVDVTSDGTVEQIELVKFVQHGLALSDEARTKYASEGKMHVAALKFFDSVKEKMIVHAYLYLNLISSG